MSLLTGWQSSGHSMYGFNSSYSSPGVFAVGRWVTCCRGVLQVWIMVGQGPTVLAVGAGGDCSVIFFLTPIISFFFLPLSGIDR